MLKGDVGQFKPGFWNERRGADSDTSLDVKNLPQREDGHYQERNLFHWREKDAVQDGRAVRGAGVVTEERGRSWEEGYQVLLVGEEYVHFSSGGILDLCLSFELTFGVLVPKSTIPN